MKAVPAALALLLAPLAMSAHAEITITPFATYQWFDTDTTESIFNTSSAPDIKDKEGFALSLGYRFTPSLGLEAHYGRTSTETEILPVISPTAVDVRNTRYSVDGYYTFTPERTIAPYVLLGVGQTQLKASGFNNNKDTMIDAGVGAFYHLSDTLALRGELRNVHNVDNDLNDQVAMIGVEFALGGKVSQSEARSEPAPAPVVEEPAPQPAATPAPVVAAPVDSDGDGVADSLDKCASTPAGAKVDAAGCPLDSDKDGVADYMDKCPDTKAGAAVDETGCYQMLQKEVSIDLNVQFASGKADIQGDASSEIQKVADFMQKYPTVNVTIEGHTDSSGSAAKNKALSQKRADAVKDAIVKLGVDASRLAAVGYGASQPIADNKTAEGRAKNRRVVATAKAQAEAIKMKQ